MRPIVCGRCGAWQFGYLVCVVCGGDPHSARPPSHDAAAERIMTWLLNETDMGSWHPNVIASVRQVIEQSIAEAARDTTK